MALKINLVTEDGTWRVSSIEQVNATKKDPTWPGRERLAKQSLLELRQALNTKDFTSFYEKIATSWKSETSPDDLKKSFRDFLDKHFLDKPADLMGSGLSLDTPPKSAPTNLLAVSGSYYAEPYNVYFSLRYVNELPGPARPIKSGWDPGPGDPNWKLVGIKVEVNLLRASASMRGMSLEP